MLKVEPLRIYHNVTPSAKSFRPGRKAESCSEYQVLRWECLVWPKDEPQKADYQCQHCSGEIQDWQKHQMLKRGEWRAANPESSTVGFWINAKWGALATKFLLWTPGSTLARRLSF